MNTCIYKLYPQVKTTLGDIAYDANGNEVAYDSAAVAAQAEKDACKTQAKLLLSASDWAVLPDVGLKNSTEFVTYRSILRGYAIQPVLNPVWPTEPQPVWEQK